MIRGRVLWWFLLALALVAFSGRPAYSQASVSLYCWNPSATSGLNQFVPCNSTTPLQVTATTAPSSATTTQAKVTIAVTSTYQQALASSTTRKGCSIQYVAVAGTKGYVFFGSAPADTTTSFQLTNGQSINCAAGDIVLTDAIQVTGNGTDIFVVANQ